MENIKARSDRVQTNDGIWLNYYDAGSGIPLMLVHGWCQSAALFKYQIEELSKFCHVIAIDFRGHGRSDKPVHGYNMARFSKDLDDILTALNIENCVLLGHSMGCGVIWGYLDLFGVSRVSKLILVDQGPYMTANSRWNIDQRATAGAIFNLSELEQICNAIRSPIRSMGYINSMLTSKATDDKRQWILSENKLLPKEHAADLLFSVATADWRSLIARIELPTLIISGEACTYSVKSQEWIQKTIAGAQLEIFKDYEGGSHLMFIENPDKFNHLVKKFITAKASKGKIYA